MLGQVRDKWDDGNNWMSGVSLMVGMSREQEVERTLSLGVSWAVGSDISRGTTGSR